MTGLLHEKLNYDVRGALFDVHNKLGPMLPEKLYSQAVSIGLEQQGIRCQTEKEFEVTHRGVQVGRYSVLHSVYFHLGPGFLHQIYRRATMVELRHQGMGYEYIKKIPILYHHHHLADQAVRLIAVDDQILVATVAMQKVTEAMKQHLRARMRYLDYKLGLIANFHGTELEIGFVRG